VLAGFGHLEVTIFDLHQLYACFHQFACGRNDHEPGEDTLVDYCLITSCQTYGHIFIIMLPPSCESADVLISLQTYFELVSNANN
jgi:hypothetical protein